MSTPTPTPALAAAEANAPAAPLAAHSLTNPASVDVAPPAAASWFRPFKNALLALAALVAVCYIGAAFAGYPVPGFPGKQPEQTVQAPKPLAIELVPKQPHTITIPEDVRVALGIRKGGVDRIVTAEAPKRTRPLMLSGSTMLDPTRLYRIRARFPARVVEITKVSELNPKTGMTEFRELHSGDRVNKGDRLGVFYSADVGQKKNDLIDALVQLELDKTILEKAEDSFRKGAIPEVFLLNARRAVEGDRNAEARALSNLRTWDIPDKDIDAVYAEAKEIGKRGGKRDKTKDDEWPRVELVAPAAGTIVERNVALDELVVDNTTNLFQIASTDRLVVVGNASEDDLPDLLKLASSDRRWSVQVATREGTKPITGRIDEISYLLDVNQHSAVVKGFIENPRDADNPAGLLRAGQFITAQVELPPPTDVVEIPVGAVVDDGKQCVVFVQRDAAKAEFTMRRVEVTHRFEKTVFVRSTPAKVGWEPTTEDKEMGLLAKEVLRPGERVLAGGVLELKKELEDRESNQAEPGAN
jgi:cobalt-zinc-cadmium efflux system membrane fusion protein